jgi:GT2 family glycosyltransferase
VIGNHFPTHKTVGAVEDYSMLQTAAIEGDYELSIIIVSWNVQEYLRRCLNSLRADVEPGLKHEIIVVDNHSSDHTIAMLTRDFPEVRLIHNRDNLGFARANNQGIESSRGKFVMLLNPDTEVKKGCISTLISFLQSHDKAGVVGPQLLNMDGTLQASGLNFPSFANSLLGYFRLKGEVTGAYFVHTDQPAMVNALVGACLLVRREVIDQVGGLDEDYFMYVEEADWCYRIQNRGWHIYYVPEAQVCHRKGGSARHVPLETYVRLRESRILFLLKHKGRTQAILLGLGYTINAFLKFLLAEKPNKSIYHQAFLRFLGLSKQLMTG